MSDKDTDVGRSSGGRPRRVIGTPRPTETQYLLGDDEGAAGPPATPRAERDEDPKKIKKAERVVAFFFGLSLLGSIGFVAAYIAFPVSGMAETALSNRWLGLSMAAAFLGVACGGTYWVRRVMAPRELVEEIHPMPSSVEERRDVVEYFDQGTADSRFLRRPLLRRALLAALVPLGIAPLVLFRDLGPLPGTVLRHTAWKKGMRLVVEGSGRHVRASDLAWPGSYITVIPEGFEHDLEALAKATVMLIKMRPEDLHLPPDKMAWTVDGIIAYSKICTHVGCPAGLYEQQTHRILCPCHQSTFDASRAAEVIFGPATRPLPQLPIGVDSEGYLIALSDFHEPVGPSFWERG
ncbi:MAG: Rieske 2Fe-2S domain-containing protein [Streptosporangiales bacterium]|nr:Rieske 2Fe-2S domain-containing protein [Streptosporangiales bacterium]